MVVLPVSYHLENRRHAVAVTSFLRIGILDGWVTLDSRAHPYHGNISDIHSGTVAYQGGQAHAKKDWSWHVRAYGIGQRTFYSERDEFVAKDIGLILPGIYYRHFEWEKEPVVWTVMVSLWYPILLLAVFPVLWIIRRGHLRLWSHKEDA